jgi:hypothetical protein
MGSLVYFVNWCSADQPVLKHRLIDQGSRPQHLAAIQECPQHQPRLPAAK